MSARSLGGSGTRQPPGRPAPLSRPGAGWGYADGVPAPPPAPPDRPPAEDAPVRPGEAHPRDGGAQAPVLRHARQEPGARGPLGAAGQRQLRVVTPAPAEWGSVVRLTPPARPARTPLLVPCSSSKPTRRTPGTTKRRRCEGGPGRPVADRVGPAPAGDNADVYLCTNTAP